MLVAVAQYVVGHCSKNVVKIASVLSTTRQVPCEVEKMGHREVGTTRRQGSHLTQMHYQLVGQEGGVSCANGRCLLYGVSFMALLS